MQILISFTNQVFIGKRDRIDKRKETEKVTERKIYKETKRVEKRLMKEVNYKLIYRIFFTWLNSTQTDTKTILTLFVYPVYIL